MTEQGTIIFEKLCGALDELKIEYVKDPNNPIVAFSMAGEPFPITIAATIEDRFGLVRLISPLPFNFNEHKRIDAAVAICYINNFIADGFFDFSIKDGSSRLMMTALYIDSDISVKLLQRMISNVYTLMGDYHDKLFALNKGYISLDELIAQLS